MQFFFHSYLVATLFCGSVLCMLALTLAVCRRKNILWHLLVSWFILFGILQIGMYCLDHASSVAKNGLKENLAGLAKSFAIALKDAGHAKVTLDAPDTDPLYWKLLNMMSDWQRDISSAASIYTFRKNEKGEIVFICCPPADLDRNGFFHGENEELVPKGEIYEYETTEDIREIIDAFWGKSGFNEEPVSDGWGVWITAAEPLFDDNDEYIDAVLGVDFWGNDWIAHVQHAIFWPKLFLLSFVVLFFVVQIFTLRRQIIAERLAEYALNLEQVTDELIEAKRESDSAVQAKSFFLANISHEIRTPMNAILGCADILANASVENQVRQDQEQLFDIMQKSGRNLMNIIDDVLTYSGIDTNRITLESVPIDLRQLVDDVKMVLDPQLKEKPQIEFRVEWDESIPRMILGDPMRLRQVFIGLVGNAIKFTETGSITLRCGTSSPSDVMVPVDSEATFSASRVMPYLHPQIAQSKGLRGMVDTTASYIGNQQTAISQLMRTQPHVLLQIDVTDTGIGIAPDQFDTIFKTFSQVDGSSTRRFGGTGLGLSIVKGLVQLMGGEVMLKSKFGEGSTFSVLIPIVESVDSAGQQVPSFSSSVTDLLKKVQKTVETSQEFPLSNYNILIVDDVPVNRIVLEAKLLEMGAKIQSATNGQEAVNLVETAEEMQQPFDLILMDLQMPVMDGFEAVKLLRQHGFTKPIVALTATVDNQAKALECGYNLVLSKPINKETLCKTILDILPAIKQSIMLSRKS